MTQKNGASVLRFQREYRGLHFGPVRPSPQPFPDGEREPRRMLDLASESINGLNLPTRRLTAPGRSAAMARQPEVAHGHPDPSGPSRPRPRARGGEWRRSRRDRAHAAHPRGVAGAAPWIAAVPHAAAVLGG